MDDPFERPALVRRETLRRLESREERYEEWFQPQDNKFKVAGTSCTQVRDIFFAKLSRKEKEAALKEAGPEDLASTITAIQTKYLSKKDRWLSSDKSETLNTVVEGFVGFAEVFTNVMEAILKPAPPEYRAAFAILNVVYKGVKERGDREEKLSQYLQRMASLIPQKDFYRQAIDTPRMKQAFSAFCTDIVKFVIAADRYCTKLSIGQNFLSNRLNSLAEAVTYGSAVKFILASTTKDPMQQFYDDVNTRADEIESLREAATFALTLEHRYKIEEIATVLSKLYEKTITNTVTPEANAILSLARYKSHSRAQKLASFLNLPPYDPQLEKIFNDTQRIHLPARDNWEYRPSLIQFPSWEQQSPRPLFWLSGPESGPGVSWVSSFSVDLIDALSVNESLISAYIFCCNGNEALILTPGLILKRLISTILSSFPQITISHVAMLPLHRFQEVNDSGLKAWELLAELLEIVQDVMVEQQKELFIIIDRLDMCISDDDEFGVRKELLPRLQEIPQRWRNTRVVVTSIVMAERVGTLRGDENWIRNVWIDTASAVSMDDPGVYDEW